MMKFLGAFLILLACGGTGFMMVASHRNQERTLKQLLRALEHMRNELQYRMPSLPELCSQASQVCTGCVGDILKEMSLELEKQMIPNAAACMYAVLNKQSNLPARSRECMVQLGECLGCFDLPGQLQGLMSVQKCAEYELEQLRRNQDVRLRSYQTLGLCTGAALIVLFL